MHKDTGDVKFVRTDLEGKLLGKDWAKLHFIKREDGEQVMRVNFDHFTIDVLASGEKEVTETNGNPSPA